MDRSTEPQIWAAKDGSKIRMVISRVPPANLAKESDFEGTGLGIRERAEGLARSAIHDESLALSTVRLPSQFDKLAQVMIARPHATGTFGWLLTRSRRAPAQSGRSPTEQLALTVNSTPASRDRYVPWVRHVDRLAAWHSRISDGQFDLEALEVLRSQIMEMHCVDVPDVDRMTLEEVAAVLERLKLPEAATSVEIEPKATGEHSHESVRQLVVLLRMYLNGVADTRIKSILVVLSDRKLTVHQKLTKIDAFLPIPPTTRASALAELLDVTKSAVVKCDWWRNHRPRKRPKRSKGSASKPIAADETT